MVRPILEYSPGGGGGGGLAGQLCTMREQKTAKLTRNSVFDILNLIPLFTVLSL